MGAMMNQHIMQAVDWSKYDLQEWLMQFGYWLGRSSVYQTSGENPIATAMKKARLKLKPAKRAEIIAQYMCDDTFHEKPKRKITTCLITDDEARAVQKLVLDIINGTNSDILLGWMNIIISKYFSGYSLNDLVRPTYSKLDVRMDIKCGLAALHSRYPFISYDPRKSA